MTGMQYMVKVKEFVICKKIYYGINPIISIIGFVIYWRNSLVNYLCCGFRKITFLIKAFMFRYTYKV